MDKPLLLSLEDAQTALWRVTPASHPNENSLAQQMYYHGKCDALRAAMQMIEGEIDVTWKSTKKEKPRVEQEVLAIIPRMYYQTCFFESGDVKFEDSEYAWEDDYDQTYIEQGWYMRLPVNDDPNNVDYNIIKVPEPSMWMSLPLPRNVGDTNGSN